MVVSPGLVTNGSGHVGLIRLAHPKIPSHRRNWLRISRLKKLSGDLSINGKQVGGYSTVAVDFARQSWNELPEEEPLWLSLVRDMVWSTRSLLSFMAEQPSQLKYIEWPSFTTTLKTATLSLCLVAVFIVALSSVDSALCYILALILRKSS